jgi:hypothetical protein
VRNALSWLGIAALGAVLAGLLSPFALWIVECVIGIAQVRLGEAPLSFGAAIAFFITPPALVPFIIVALIFRGTYRSLRGRS